MNKIIAWSLVVVLLSGTFGISSVQARVADVPTDHWAYNAVVNLVNKGYLPVYEDGTFQGTRAVDRYTLAVTLARILDEIQSGHVQASQDDLGLLRELTTEFREELVLWYATRDSFEKLLEHALQTTQVTEDRVNRVVAAQMLVQREVEQLRLDLLKEAELRVAQFVLHDMAIKEAKEALGQQQSLLGQQSADLKEQEELLGRLQRALGDLEQKQLLNSAAIDSLDNWKGEKSAVIATLHAQDAKLQEELAGLTQLINVLLQDSMGKVEISVEQMEGSLKGLIQDLEQKQEEEALRVFSLERKVQGLDGSMNLLEANLATLDEDVREIEAELVALVGVLQLMDNRIGELLGVVASSDGRNIRELELLKVAIREIDSFNEALERDLASLAVRLRQEGINRSQEDDGIRQEIVELRRELRELETQIGLSEEEFEELKKKVTEEVAVQMNAALIREQRLERQLKELQEDFETYKVSSVNEMKSVKGQATIAMVVAALGIIVGLISGNANK